MAVGCDPTPSYTDILSKLPRTVKGFLRFCSLELGTVSRRKDEKMTAVKASGGVALESVKSLLPRGILGEIEGIIPTGSGLCALSEVRLRARALSAIVFRGRNITLDSRVSEAELADILKRACDMAIFAHRDDLCRGFVPLAGGARLGVIGQARYEGGVMVGVGEISSLVFRIPTGECSFGPALYDAWEGRGRRSMLVCSPAGVGKTTAIRYLAGRIGSGASPRRVVVVDERCEFDPYSYRTATVDILRGYRRKTGIDIAIRTMSAEVIIVDEIGSDSDSDALLAALGAGVCVIATAHSDSVSGALARPRIARLAANGLFADFVLISRTGGAYSLKFEDNSAAMRGLTAEV